MEHCFVLNLVDQDYLDEVSKLQQTNGDCLRQSLNDTNLRLRVQNLITRNPNQFPGPILYFEFVSDDILELDCGDIREVCEVFGQVSSVEQMDPNRVIVIWENIIDCYFAQRILNAHFIQDLNLQMFVRWCNQVEFQQLQKRQKQKAQLEVQAQTKKPLQQPKFTCRYEILVENDSDFQVARKIIGSKGCNMKKIIDQCCDPQSQIVKLRLRGKGSGYKEGPSKQESSEPLHLCVSSKSQSHFSRACQLVENLLQKIFDEYQQQNRHTKQVFYRKIQNKQGQALTNNVCHSHMDYQHMMVPRMDKLMMR